MDDFFKDLLAPVLGFAYTVSHWLGLQIVGMIRLIYPGPASLEQIIDPVGVLAVLTALLLVVQVTRKIAWIVVAAGWFLIGIRVVLLLTSQGS